MNFFDSEEFWILLTAWALFWSLAWAVLGFMAGAAVLLVLALFSLCVLDYMSDDG